MNIIGGASSKQQTVQILLHFRFDDWRNFRNATHTDNFSCLYQAPIYLTWLKCWSEFKQSTHSHTQPFNGPMSETTWVSQYRKKHSPIHTHEQEGFTDNKVHWMGAHHLHDALSQQGLLDPIRFSIQAKLAQSNNQSKQIYIMQIRGYHPEHDGSRKKRQLRGWLFCSTEATNTLHESRWNSVRNMSLPFRGYDEASHTVNCDYQEFCITKAYSWSDSVKCLACVCGVIPVWWLWCNR